MKSLTTTKQKSGQIKSFEARESELKTLADKAYKDYQDYSEEIKTTMTLNLVSGNSLITFLKFLSQEKDRSHKQYLSAVQALKQLHSSPLKVNIKTNSAYVAQNQQNNFEINDPQ